MRSSPAIEAVARVIYDQWQHIEGWRPWVDGGNSHKQDDARRLAHAALTGHQVFPRDPSPEMVAHWRKGRVVQAYVGSQEKADAAAVKRWQDFFDAVTDGVSASGTQTFPSHTPMKDTGRKE